MPLRYLCYVSVDARNLWQNSVDRGSMRQDTITLLEDVELQRPV